jgi:hypothetical protein
MSDTKSARKDGFTSAEAGAKYRSILDGTDERPTTAVIRFPRPIGPHTYNLNDQVAFSDRGSGRTGRITHFERYERLIYASVEVPGHGSILVDLRKALFIEHPDAAAMAAPGVHLRNGTVVRVTMPAGKTWGGMSTGDLGVVMADKGELVNVVKLGGDDREREGYARLNHAALAVVTADPRTGTVTG